MSRQLPSDLKKIILSYFSLPVLQKQYEVQPNFPLKDLIRYVYGPKAVTPFAEVKSWMTDKISKSITGFDFYVRHQLIDGKMGYNGHLYIPMLYMLISAVQNNDEFFIKYYFDRVSPLFFGAKDIILYLALKHNCSDEILAYLLSQGYRILIGNLPLNQLLRNNHIEATADIELAKNIKIDYNLIKGLVTLNLPLIEANINAQREFPNFLPLHFLQGLNQIYTLQNHRVVNYLRNYLSVRFAENNYLKAYFFLLDVLLGKPLPENQGVVNNLFSAVSTLAAASKILALSVLNTGVYNQIKNHPAAGDLDYPHRILYSEVLHDDDLPSGNGFYSEIETVISISKWIADKKEKLFLTFPVIDHYRNIIFRMHDLAYDPEEVIKITADADTQSYELITKIQDDQKLHRLETIHDMETAVWIANRIDYKYFESEYILLQPDTYVNYLGMVNAGFDPKIIDADGPQLEAAYRGQQEFEHNILFGN